MSRFLSFETYSHLEFCNCAVLIVHDLVFHGAEVHWMFDDHRVSGSDCISYWK